MTSQTTFYGFQPDELALSRAHTPTRTLYADMAIIYNAVSFQASVWMGEKGGGRGRGQGDHRALCINSCILGCSLQVFQPSCSHTFDSSTALPTQTPHGVQLCRGSRRRARRRRRKINQKINNFPMYHAWHMVYITDKDDCYIQHWKSFQRTRVQHKLLVTCQEKQNPPILL